MPLYGDVKREYDRTYIAKRRADYLEGKCCIWPDCGSTGSLEVDHVDPKTKLIRISSVWNMSESNPRRVAELAKCQVLCKHHHAVKSAIEKSLRESPSSNRPCRKQTKYVMQ